MARSNGKRGTQNSRSNRASRGEEKVVKEKFMEGRIERINTKPLVPMNEKQRDYIRKINTHSTVLACGWPGTSKTYIPTVMACDAYLTGAVEKIIFTRPNISNSKSLGFFSGDKIEKCRNWLMPVISILNERLGKNTVDIALKNEDIEFVPLETIKGNSFKNAFFIVDEAEDITREEAKKIITRAGEGTKCCLVGDLGQSELGKNSGLKMLIEMANKYPHLDVGVVDFNHVNDIVRSKSVRDWIIAFNKEEK